MTCSTGVSEKSKTLSIICLLVGLEDAAALALTQQHAQLDLAVRPLELVVDSMPSDAHDEIARASRGT